MMDAKLKIAMTALRKITKVPLAEFDMTTVAKIAQTAFFDIDAIAPPVDAGSVDLLPEKECLGGDEAYGDRVYGFTEDQMIAWGAQQRIEGKREGADTVAMAEQMKLFRSAHDEACIELTKRAEKAEADYKIVCDKNDILRKYCEAAQASEEKWQGNAEKAEARADQLSSDLLSAHGDRDAYLSRSIDAEARVKELEAKVDELESSLEEIVHRGE